MKQSTLLWNRPSTSILFVIFLTILAPTAFAIPANIEIEGWNATIAGASDRADGSTFAQSVRIDLPGVMGGQALVIPSVVFLNSKDGISYSIASSGVGTEKTEIRSTNGFRFQAEDYSLSNEGLLLGGTLTLPEALKIDDLHVKMGELRLDPDGALVGSPQVSDIHFVVSHYPLRSGGLVLDESGLKLKNCLFDIPSEGTSAEKSSAVLALGDLMFLSDASLARSDYASNKVEIEKGGAHIRIEGACVQAMEFSAGLAIVVSGDFGLPKPYDGAVIRFSRMVMAPDGNVYKSQGDDLNASFHIGIFSVHFKDAVNFNTQEPKYQFDDISIVLPPELGGQKISFSQGSEISPDGSINSNGFACDPFTFLGMNTELKSIGFGPEGFRASGGGLQFPKSFPGGLGGVYLGIKSLKIDLSGQVQALDIESDGTSVSLGKFIYIDNPRFTLGRGKAGSSRIAIAGSSSISLSSPSQRNRTIDTTLSISSLPLDIDGNRYCVEELQALPLKLSAGGLDFELNLVEADAEFDLRFQGKAVVGTANSLKGKNDIAGPSVVVDDFQINSDGSLGPVRLSDPSNPSKSYWASLGDDGWILSGDSADASPQVKSRGVVNAPNIAYRDAPAASAKVLGHLDVGTVIDIFEQSPAVDSIDGKYSRYFHFNDRTGRSGWIFGGYVDPLKLEDAQ
jgi:hypothetical protein